MRWVFGPLPWTRLMRRKPPTASTAAVASDVAPASPQTSTLRRKLGRLLFKAFIALVALLLVAAALVVTTPQGRTAWRTALFVPQVLPAVPIKPQTWFTRGASRQEVSYPLAQGRGIADVYRPAGSGKHSAVLLFLGVNPAGRDDPRVVNLGLGLARAGMGVMLPWSETMTSKRIAVEEVDNLVRAFQFLRAQDWVDQNRVGMGGFCVGASLAAVAAEDDRVRDHVRFLNFFGGYYDATNLVKAVVSRSRSQDERREPWSPDGLSVEVVTTHLVESVPDPKERELMEAAFIRRDRVVEVAPSALSPPAAAVYRLLRDPAADEVDALISRLSPSFLASMRAISPSTHIDKLRARVLVMHDREDDLVPSEESRRLATALGPESRVYRTEFSFFRHVDPTRSVGPLAFVSEGFKLFLHMYNVLREAS